MTKMPLENMGKEDYAGNQYFLLSPKCFLPLPLENSISTKTLIFMSANALYLVESKILSFGKVLKSDEIQRTIPIFVDFAQTSFD